MTLAGSVEELFNDDLAVVWNEEHGEVFTRRWVVELVLDLAGYTADRDLGAMRLVEPACGSGAFLEVIVERLVVSAHQHDRDLASLGAAIRATDLLPQHVQRARTNVERALGDHLIARMLADQWVQHADYLLSEFEPESVDFVVGNPPYVRIEDMSPARQGLYRKRWTTMGGRADLFIGFYERGLRSLKPGGSLGFICADRWMRNQYGKGLRELIVGEYSVDTVITMHDVDAFEEEVSAYPAITVIRAEQQSTAVVANTTSAFSQKHGHEVACLVPNLDGTATAPDGAFTLARLPRWFSTVDSWPQGSAERLAMIENLTDHFPPLEDPDTETKVGIGVASGADKVFVVKGKVDVEEDRLLPMAMANNLNSGTMLWSGHYLVNPWGERGPVNLDDYPKLRAYYEAHGEALKRRYIARNGKAWYSTIDRVTPALTSTLKLYVADMRMELNPVLDAGETYPHHNLYVITSKTWDLEVLGGLLLSKVANAFIEAYAVKMRGGTLRFQAQYLRRIRLPRHSDVGLEDTIALREAFKARDVEAATKVALRLYGLDHFPE